MRNGHIEKSRNIPEQSAIAEQISYVVDNRETQMKKYHRAQLVTATSGLRWIGSECTDDGAVRWAPAFTTCACFTLCTAFTACACLTVCTTCGDGCVCAATVRKRPRMAGNWVTWCRTCAGTALLSNIASVNLFIRNIDMHVKKFEIWRSMALPGNCFKEQSRGEVRNAPGVAALTALEKFLKFLTKMKFLKFTGFQGIFPKTITLFPKLIIFDVRDGKIISLVFFRKIVKLLWR